ncbi:hypothetical protein J1N35_045306 [Gossypium stocksii]|uniref:Uncharacterized protein n=1 Tax=Gossypium stocksii TaxID=47602 RepID=A0A9D3UAX0_9ROSI|nr:hypothetical protein J1N35_045306 [Gossypium stocksii]
MDLAGAIIPFGLWKFLDNMLHEEISIMANSNHSEGKSRGVPAENGHAALALKFKQRKVSAIRDFPPGAAGWLY